MQMPNRVLGVLAAGLVMSGCFQADVDVTGNGRAVRGGGTAAADSGWAETAAQVAGSVFLETERGLLLYAFDTVARAKEETILRARLQERLQGVARVPIGFYRGKKLIGRATTDAAGFASVKWTPPKSGDYYFTARVILPPEAEDVEEDSLTARLAGLAAAPMMVAVRPAGTRFVLIDLDHTVVASSFVRVLLGGAEPMPGSVDATRRLAKKYTIVYLTHRPDLLMRKSKLWLTQHDFPRAPLLVSGIEEAIGGSGPFKTERIRSLRETYRNLEIGIGDKYSDAQAYINNGMTAYLLPHYDADDPEDLREAAAAIRAIDGKGRLQVVQDWEEVEAGIFQGKRFPPERYIRAFVARAQRLEQREQEEEDDD